MGNIQGEEEGERKMGERGRERETVKGEGDNSANKTS